jgi:hypothetical protein
LETVALYLEKFRHLLSSEAAFKDAVIKVFKVRFNVDLASKDIVAKEGLVQIACSPALKSRIFMDREAILEDINKMLGGTVKGIR